jgi:hypothetical protein
MEDEDRMSDGYYYFDRLGNEIDEKTWELYRMDPMYFTLAETEIETEGVRIVTVWAGRTRTEKTDKYMPAIFSTTVIVDRVTQDSYETDSTYLSGGNTQTEGEALVMHESGIRMTYNGAFREQIENVIGPEKSVVPEENPCEEVRL